MSEGAKRRKHIKRRELFHEQGGRCGCCGVDMVLPDTLPQTRHPMPNAACLYHMYSRYHSERERPHAGPSYLVVCVSCANTMSAAETSVQSLANLYARSGRAPALYLEKKERRHE